jgi:hypothetical protein
MHKTFFYKILIVLVSNFIFSITCVAMAGDPVTDYISQQKEIRVLADSTPASSKSYSFHDA